MAELKTIIVPLERTVDTYRIVYDVDESLASEGNCWGRSDGGRSDGVMCEFSTKPIKEETGGLTARWADTGSRGWRGSCGSIRRCLLSRNQPRELPARPFHGERGG